MALLRLLGVAVVLALPYEVRAQDEPTPAEPAPAPVVREEPVVSRDDLVAQAEAAADRGDHDSARALAEQAAELRETPSLRLFIAQQQALTGRVADAIESARRCAAEAGTALRNRQAILSTCTRLERSLLRRIALVTVRVPSPREGLHVRVNGQEVPADRWGVAMPVPPGEVSIEATAGEAAMRQILRIDAGDESTIELSFAGGELRSEERREEEEGGSAPEPISPFWIAVPAGAAVAMAISAIATGAAVLERGGTYDELAGRCALGDGAACGDAGAARSEGEGLRDATNVLWTTAAIAGAAAIAMIFFVDWNGVEARSARQRGGSWAALRF